MCDIDDITIYNGKGSYIMYSCGLIEQERRYKIIVESIMPF